MSVVATGPTVGEILSEGREIIAVKTTDTVHQVIRALGENGINLVIVITLKSIVIKLVNCLMGKQVWRILY